MQIISLIFNKNDEVSSLTEDIKMFYKFLFQRTENVQIAVDAI